MDVSASIAFETNSSCQPYRRQMRWWHWKRWKAYSIDASIFTPAFGFCAIAVTTEASYATCSRTLSNVSLIRSESVVLYSSSTKKRTLGLGSMDNHNTAKLTWYCDIWQFSPYTFLQRVDTILLQSFIRCLFGQSCDIFLIFAAGLNQVFFCTTV